MNNIDDSLRENLRQNPRPLPATDLAARIIRQATAQPQRISGWLKLQRALDELSYGWQFKLASLALCGVLGVFAGQWQGYASDDELLLSAQLLDSALYTEEP